MDAVTREMRRAIEEAGDEPPRFFDQDTSTAYVLLRSEVYDRIRALLEPDNGIQPAELASEIWQVMKGDWDDPAMDAYDDVPEA